MTTTEPWQRRGPCRRIPAGHNAPYSNEHTQLRSVRSSGPRRATGRLASHLGCGHILNYRLDVPYSSSLGSAVSVKKGIAGSSSRQSPCAVWPMVARTAAMQRGRTGRRFLLYSLALSSAALARPGLPRRALQFASLPGKDAAANSTAGCRDAQAECAGWASRGECDANPAFMLTSCADSCTRCAEGPHGVGKPRSLAEMQARRDTFCGNM